MGYVSGMKQLSQDNAPIHRSISLWRLVFIQSLTTGVGFILLFGACTQQVLRWQLSRIEPQKIQDIHAVTQTIMNSQVSMLTSDFTSMLDRVCVSLDCGMEEISCTETSSALFLEESCKLQTSIALYNIPIFLDVLRAHPYVFTLSGLEVHGFEEPSQIQVRLSRTSLDGDVAQPDWLEALSWNDEENERLEVLYKFWLVNKWEKVRGLEKDRSQKTWADLYLTLNQSLWTVHLEKGSLIYRPETGMVVKSDTEIVR